MGLLVHFQNSPCSIGKSSKLTSARTQGRLPPLPSPVPAQPLPRARVMAQRAQEPISLPWDKFVRVASLSPSPLSPWHQARAPQITRSVCGSPRLRLPSDTALHLWGYQCRGWSGASHRLFIAKGSTVWAPNVVLLLCTCCLFFQSSSFTDLFESSGIWETEYYEHQIDVWRAVIMEKNCH